MSCASFRVSSAKRRLGTPRTISCRMPRTWWIANAIAAAVALAAWAAAFILSRRRIIKPFIVLTPADQFREAVNESRRAKQKWAALADATRAYLAAQGIGSELTTTEVLRSERDEVVRAILERGDLEKFSPWGAPPDNFESIAQRREQIAAGTEVDRPLRSAGAGRGRSVTLSAWRTGASPVHGRRGTGEGACPPRGMLA